MPMKVILNVHDVWSNFSNEALDKTQDQLGRFKMSKFRIILELCFLISGEGDVRRMGEFVGSFLTRWCHDRGTVENG